MRPRQIVNPEAFRILSPYEQGWVVGFLEGEGSFSLIKANPTSDLRYPSIQANQKFREPLDHIARIFGGRVYFARHSGAQARRSGVEGFFAWRIIGVGTSDIMRDLRPHMSPRRQQQIDHCVEGELRRPARGEGNVTAKITEADVRFIRDCSLTNVALAKRFGLCPASISRIRHRHTWAHV